MAVISGGQILSGGEIDIISQNLGSPAAAGAAVLAATSSAAGSTVTTGITNPDVPRNVVCTPGGTAANVTAVSVIVNGTNVFGQTISETLPAFTAGALTAVTGVKAFATITSIVIPLVGASTTVAVTTGSKLGLNRPMSRNGVLEAYLNGVREGTAPTVTTSNAAIELNTVQLNSAYTGTPVIVDAYDAF